MPHTIVACVYDLAVFLRQVEEDLQPFGHCNVLLVTQQIFVLSEPCNKEAQEPTVQLFCSYRLAGWQMIC